MTVKLSYYSSKCEDINSWQKELKLILLLESTILANFRNTKYLLCCKGKSGPPIRLERKETAIGKRITF